MRFVMVLALSLIAAGCENATSGQTASGGGAGGRGGRGRGGQTVATETVAVQRMAVQREVDLSGTLLSPDQARVSSEVAGIIRDVPVQLGTEVRAGDLLVRLEPRELQLALDRAEGQLHQIEAQREHGKSPREAIHEACLVRFRPI
ncbi:MAG: biotin/lipoyl-binding protein, partial [Acidobacteria bacterium]|nr:biotin/lipoyl-binding protein [Acidobacteriota bacterium]